MKNTLYTILACGSFLLSQNITNAQFEKLNSQDLQKLKQRDIIVIVEATDDKVLDKVNKKGGKVDYTDAYKKDIDDYNANMKHVIEKFWKYGTGTFEYMSADEVKAISSSDKKRYAVIYCHSTEGGRLSGGYGEDPGLVWSPDVKDKNKVKGSEDYYTEMGVALLENYKSPICQLPLPDLFPDKADLIYAVQVMTNSFNGQIDHPKKMDDKELASMLKENQDNLKDKTLVLRRDWLDKLLTKPDLEKAYPFPYMIVGRDTLERIMDSADAKYAVAVVTPWLRGSTVLVVDYVISCDDGTMLGACMPNMGTAPETAFTPMGSKKMTIGKRNLADLCQYIKETPEKKHGKK
jgi:hypothetical protein